MAIAIPISLGVSWPLTKKPRSLSILSPGGVAGGDFFAIHCPLEEIL